MRALRRCPLAAQANRPRFTGYRAPTRFAILLRGWVLPMPSVAWAFTTARRTTGPSPRFNPVRCSQHARSGPPEDSAVLCEELYYFFGAIMSSADFFGAAGLAAGLASCLAGAGRLWPSATASLPDLRRLFT